MYAQDISTALNRWCKHSGQCACRCRTTETRCRSKSRRGRRQVKVRRWISSFLLSRHIFADSASFAESSPGIYADSASFANTAYFWLSQPWVMRWAWPQQWEWPEWDVTEVTWQLTLTLTLTLSTGRGLSSGRGLSGGRGLNGDWGRGLEFCPRTPDITLLTRTPPNFWPMSIVAKRLDGWRRRLIRM